MDQSEASRGHLWRHNGFRQAHMGDGSCISLCSEIGQLTYSFTFSLWHLGQTG